MNSLLKKRGELSEPFYRKLEINLSPKKEEKEKPISQPKIKQQIKIKFAALLYFFLESISECWMSLTTRDRRVKTILAGASTIAVFSTGVLMIIYTNCKKELVQVVPTLMEIVITT